MKWAIVGASDIAATRVIPALRHCGQTAAVVVSSDLDRARAYARENAIDAASDHLQEALNSGVDAAYIGSHNHRHFEHAMAAIAAGLHVMCEKPIALNVEQAHTMVQAADAAGVVLATNHHLRNHPVHIAARSLIRRGAIGDLLAVTISHAILLRESLRGWRLEEGGGVALDLAVHDIDLLRYITGLEATSVTAVGARQGLSSGPPDALMASGVLGSSTLFSMHSAFTVPHRLTGIELHGTRASLIGHDCLTPTPTGSLELIEAGTSTAMPVPPVHDLYSPGILNLVAAAGGEGAPSASGRDGLCSLTFALAVEESLRQSVTVTALTSA